MSNQRGTPVSVSDFDMPFLSMVRFMVKWAFASIPALLILVILGVLFWGAVLSFFYGRKPNFSPTPADHSSSSSAPVIPTSPAADPALAAYLPKILVRNLQVSKTTLGEDAVFGEVKNVGDRTLKEVEITVYCLGPDSKTIFEKHYHPVLVSDYGFGAANRPLKPGYSRQFGVKLDDAPSEWSKKVNVKVTALQFE